MHWCEWIATKLRLQTSTELGMGPLCGCSCSNFCFPGCPAGELTIAIYTRYGLFERSVAHRSGSPGFWMGLDSQHHVPTLPGAQQWLHESGDRAGCTAIHS